MKQQIQILRLLCASIFFMLFFVCSISAQNYSNIGKDFWVTHTGHTDGASSKFKVYISSTVNTSVTVSVPLQGWTTTVPIVANTFAIVQVPSTIGKGT